eukprot:CCRYP_005737-RB/>CCRYP_005737-RB protein AED:0.06 eAED:0.06 QI:0/0.9/0.90/1/0.7/0.54/11/4727/67
MTLYKPTLYKPSLERSRSRTVKKKHSSSISLTLAAKREEEAPAIISVLNDIDSTFYQASRFHRLWNN